MYISGRHSFSIDLNAEGSHIFARNTTHVQIAVENDRMAGVNVNLFAEYSKLSEIQFYAKGRSNYCRREYWRNITPCPSNETTTEFAASLSKYNYATDNVEALRGVSGCGFCDFLFGAVDPDFSLRSYDQLINIQQARGESSRSVPRTSTSSACELRRAVRELAQQHDEHCSEIFIPGRGQTAAAPVFRNFPSPTVFRFNSVWSKNRVRRHKNKNPLYYWDWILRSVFCRPAVSRVGLVQEEKREEDDAAVFFDVHKVMPTLLNSEF